MPLPAAPASAVAFLMAGPGELVTARAVPSPDHLSGPLRDATRDVRRAVTQFDQIKVAGRALVDARSKVHAEDQRAASRAMGAGKALGESKLLLHDAELADQAERLSAAAGAVVASVRDLEAVAPEAWARNAERIASRVAEHVTVAEGALSEARKAIAAVDAIAGVLAWTQRRHVVPDSHVAQAIDALDHAQERIAVIRDGEAPADPNLIAAPAHAGMSSAWADATSPVGT